MANKVIDNTTLSLIALKSTLSTYLNSVGWTNNYTIAISGDPDILNKTPVKVVKDYRKEIGIPLILLDTGNARITELELGNDEGEDVITLSVGIIAVDSAQLRALSGLISHKLNDLTFSIYNYQGHNRTTPVGTGWITSPIFTNLTDFNNPNLIERYAGVINSNLYLPTENLI